MSRVDLELTSKIVRTPRVLQIEGIFDVPEKSHASASFHFDVPLEEREWTIGLIVGPSGTGKTQIAKRLFGDSLREAYSWGDGAIVDGFGDMPIRDIVGALSSVGFASPPGWLKPYAVLSNGERFRVNLARAILDSAPLVAIDEFSSVVDRRVACIGAHASAKAVRSRPGKRFVAVTCHEDVLEWLQPDWVMEPHLERFSWRSLQPRPSVHLEIVRCERSAWRWFAPHHYLSGELNRTSRCFAGLIEGQPAAFAALMHQPHPRVRDISRVHRLVILPDYQGLGIGAHAFIEGIGSIIRAVGRRMTIVTSHPALIRSWAKSTKWKMKRAPSLAQAHHGSGYAGSQIGSSRRRTAGFEYIGPACDVHLASRLFD